MLPSFLGETEKGTVACVPAHETEEGFHAMTLFYRIGIAHRFCSPVHVACRGPRYCVYQHKAGRKICPCREGKPFYAAQNSIKGYPNVKSAADFTLLRKIGRTFFVLYCMTRCRGPPPSEFQKFRWKRRKAHVAAQR